MKVDLLVVDPLSEPSHHNFNVEFIKFLDAFKISWVCCAAEESKYSGFNILYAFKKSLLNKRFRLFYTIAQIYILLHVLTSSVLQKKRRVLFLSYELPSMVIVSHLFRLFNIKIYLVEHNTFVPKSKLKSILFTYIASDTCHVCLAPYISEYIHSKYKRESIGLWHPIPMARNVSENVINNRVFMPSSTINPEVKRTIFDAFKSGNKYTLYAKGEEASSGDGSLCIRQFYDDYFSFIYSSYCVIIPQNFDYRVSGVFFEALMSRSIIVLSDCIFGRSMKKAFPERVIIITDWSLVLEELDKLSVAAYNSSPSSTDFIDLNDQSSELLTRKLLRG